MSGNNSKKIAFNYFGGKFSFIEYLYENFPPKFTHLVDLFAGSMVVSLIYRGNVIRTANEINGEITNFFEQLREHEDELIRMLELTPCSELEYRKCWGGAEGITDLERARRFYVRVRQSFFGLGVQRQNKGWHMSKQHVNAQGGETVSRWKNGVEKLHEVAQEIRRNFQNVRAKKALQYVDHSCIFLLIAGTYTPFMLNLMPNWIGITICTACWIIAAFGIIFQPWLMKKSDKLNTFLYLFQGWLVLFAFKPGVEALPVTGLVLLVAGGLLYSFGTIFYNWQRLPYHHAVWHLFVLGGSVTHYFAVMYTI